MGYFFVAKRYGGGNGVRGFDFESRDRGHALASVLHLKVLTQEEVPAGCEAVWPSRGVSVRIRFGSPLV